MKKHVKIDSKKINKRIIPLSKKKQGVIYQKNTVTQEEAARRHREDVMHLPIEE